MLAQMFAQGFGQVAATVLAQGEQARFAEHQQRTERGAVFLDHTEARFGDPVMGYQGLLEHRQRDAFFFQFDDAVQSPQQFEATIGGNACGVGAVFDVAGRQIRRRNKQGAVAVLAQFDASKRLPQRLALTPGDAAGFRTAEDFCRPLLQALLQTLRRFRR